MNRITILAAVAALALFTSTARAGIDAPGRASFEYVASDSEVFPDFASVPEGETFSAEAYFSSNSSRYGETGLFVWVGFDGAGTDGGRYGILLLDIDLSQAPLDGETPVPAGSWQAEYLEKRGDDVLFHGEAVVGELWLLDLFFSHGDDGAAELDLALVFSDPRGRWPGCRALMQGRLHSEPSPGELRLQRGLPPDSTETVYIDTGCSGDIYLADDTGEGCACGGDDPDAGGCEGDTEGDSGCEGDSGGSAGCEGDSGGCGEASGSGACSGSSSSNCATAGRRPGPLKRFSRYLPQLLALLLVASRRRRRR